MFGCAGDAKDNVLLVVNVCCCYHGDGLSGGCGGFVNELVYISSYGKSGAVMGRNVSGVKI